MAIMVTGASGFIGSRFMEYNKSRYHLIPVSLRTTNPHDLDLTGIQVIVHLAVVAHDFSKVNSSIQFEVNYNLTKQLADHARKSGVSQFIFLSTAKVYGEGSNEILNENSACYPQDAYGKSKLQAEEYLLSIQTDQFKVAIIRPPIVYGPAVKGNMLRLMQLALKKIPLPFGHINNQRSMVYIDNLIELINTIIERQAAGLFIAGDEKPVSTTDLVKLIRNKASNTGLIFSIPSIVRLAIKKLKPSIFNRLYGSFVMDTTSTNSSLHFIPPYSTEHGIKQMVDWYIQKERLPAV
jgi:nucleoside-diphosphate-sugar epimerase